VILWFLRYFGHVEKPEEHWVNVFNFFLSNEPCDISCVRNSKICDEFSYDIFLCNGQNNMARSEQVMLYF